MSEIGLALFMPDYIDYRLKLYILHFQAQRTPAPLLQLVTMKMD